MKCSPFLCPKISIMKMMIPIQGPFRNVKRHDWEEWQKAIRIELFSLNKRNVFGPIVITPENINLVGYKWVFVRKVTRYKTWLVAQRFSQRPEIDFEEMYSPVMDAIMFRFLMSLMASKNLEMHLIDVLTTYLYGSLDKDICMKLPDGLKMPGALKEENPGRFVRSSYNDHFTD